MKERGDSVVVVIIRISRNKKFNVIVVHWGKQSGDWVFPTILYSYFRREKKG